jgi:hypothetical protein
MNNPQARLTDPDTSHAAAASVDNLTRTRRRILDLLRVFGPMTDQQIRFTYTQVYDEPISDSGLRTRRRELVDAEFVRDSGQRQQLASGRNGIVWEATTTDGTA